MEILNDEEFLEALDEYQDLKDMFRYEYAYTLLEEDVKRRDILEEAIDKYEWKHCRRQTTKEIQF